MTATYRTLILILTPTTLAPLACTVPNPDLIVESELDDTSEAGGEAEDPDAEPPPDAPEGCLVSALDEPLACASCLEQGCCAELEACAEDSACGCLSDCLGIGGQLLDCALGCGLGPLTTLPDELVALSSCATESCAESCTL